MRITCPACHFSREIPEAAVPARSEMATCPKCKMKFRFRTLDPAPAQPLTAQAGPAKGDDGTEPAASPVAPPRPEAGPTKGDDGTGPAKGDDRAGPAKGDDRAGPAKGDDRAGPAKGDDRAGPAKGDDDPEALWQRLDHMPPPAGGAAETAGTDRGQGSPPTGNGAAGADPRPREEPQTSPGLARDEGPEGATRQRFPKGPVPPPFEQLDRYGFFRGFGLTVKLVLTSPRLFFSVMPVDGGLSRPLVFVILLGLIETVVSSVWGMARVTGSLGGEQAGVMDQILAKPAVPLLVLLLLPAVIAAVQFLVSGLFHLSLVLVSRNTRRFEGTFRALAYANVPLLLGLIPIPVSGLAQAWVGVISAWNLALIVIGLQCIHRLSLAKVLTAVLLPVLALGLLWYLLFLSGPQLPTV